VPSSSNVGAAEDVDQTFLRYSPTELICPRRMRIQIVASKILILVVLRRFLFGRHESVPQKFEGVCSRGGTLTLLSKMLM
jgi:hypothetical protein